MSATGVLFDLDGTLVDTAPDIIGCVHALLAERGREAVPARALETTVSHGARMVISYAFAVPPETERARELEAELVQRYRSEVGMRSGLYPGMPEVLEALEHEGVPWGVVTNKPARLAQPLLQRLGLSHRAGAVICGDTLERAKPHPQPIQYAARALGCSPETCWTIGDARRDIDAAMAAGSFGLVALFGYLHAGDRPAHWGAHGLLWRPMDLLAWVSSSSTVRS